MVEGLVAAGAAGCWVGVGGGYERAGGLVVAALVVWGFGAGGHGHLPLATVVVVETERDDKSKVVQAVWWCALLLVANVIVGIMVLVKLQEIAKALGA